MFSTEEIKKILKKGVKSLRVGAKTGVLWAPWVQEAHNTPSLVDKLAGWLHIML